MTDLERAVKAAFLTEYTASSWGKKIFDTKRADYEKAVRAAIEALMEPSEEAAKAGVFQIKWALATDPNNDFEIGLATDCFQAMLRAVLEGK